MKTFFKKNVLIGTGFLVGIVASPRQFSDPTSAGSPQHFHSVTAYHQKYGPKLDRPGGDATTRIERHPVVINAKLAELQDEIYGTSRAEVIIRDTNKIHPPLGE